MVIKTISIEKPPVLLFRERKVPDRDGNANDGRKILYTMLD